MLDDNVWPSLVGMLVAIVVIIGLAYWFTRYIAGGSAFRSFGMSQGGRLKVLDSVRLGKDQQLTVVQAGERYFLLGVTGQNVSLLAEFTPEEAAQWHREAQAGEGKGTPDFKQAFFQALQNRKQR